ncbi:MAG: hypothetical protein DCC58_04830 [Chloroflexi bacterium]|nr:MAG: hypothetical protein DCC58_04830 [Chloroflexota bacterium]
MMTVISAAWRVVLKRSISDWLILAAAFLTIILATTLLAAGPIYADAVTLSGVRRTLHDAPVRDANLEISARIRGPEYAQLDSTVVSAGNGAFATTGAELWRTGRSESFALPGQEPDAVTDLVVFSFFEEFESRVDLVAGSWPADVPGEFNVQALLLDATAQQLGLTVGDRVAVQSRREADRIVTVEISGLFTIRDRLDPYWWEDTLVLDGVQVGESFTTYGPFVTSQAAFLEKLSTSSSEVNWRIYPYFDNLDVDEVPQLRGGVETLDAVLNFGRGPNERFTVETDLDGILRRAERSLLVTRSGVFILTVQLAILAGYALVLTAGLLIEQRRIETALLRSRGADNSQIATMALMEGLVLAVPAAVFGPWIAAFVLRALNHIGPLDAIDLTINPVVTREAYVLAMVAAIGCVVALVVPAHRSARLFVQARSSLGRQASQGLAQRAGIDLVMVVIAGLALWQLRRYGAPITETVKGRLSLDPFLIAAPAIGLLAGAVVALRLVPLLARVAERSTTGRKSLVPSLGAWQLSRRPLRYARSALLLMLALAIGLFAVAYSRTWSVSQQDQADYRIGGDIRLRPDIRVGRGIPMYSLSNAHRSLDGVDETLPVLYDSLTVSRSAGQADVLGIDATRAAGVVNFREDLSTQPFDALLARLAEGRPELAAVELVGSPARLAFDLRVQLDPPPDDLPVPPEELPSIAPSFSIVIQDAGGMLYRISGGPLRNELSGEPQRVELNLAFRMADGRVATPEYPVSLVSIDFRALPTPRIPRSGVFEIQRVQASADLDGGAWTDVALPTNSDDWTTKFNVPIGALDPPQISRFETAVEGNAVRLSFSVGSLVGTGSIAVVYALSFGPNELEQTIPALVSQRFLDLTESRIGETVPLDLGRERRAVQLVGVIDGFPTLNPHRYSLVIVDLPSFAMLEYASDGNLVVPDEWWLAADDAEIERVALDLQESPYFSPRVQDRVSEGRKLLNDPVALGNIGSLALGFVAAGLFAALGFAVSAAVSARERLTEFALLRALGLSTGQLTGWLTLENGLLVGMSIAGGTVLGLVLAWSVLPLVSLTQEAAAVVPAVIVVIPWKAVLALEAVTIVVLIVVVIALAAFLRRLGLGSVLRLGGE